MYVVGLTGGIGSGKTAASDYLASLGIGVVDAMSLPAISLRLASLH